MFNNKTLICYINSGVVDIIPMHDKETCAGQ